MKGKHKNKRLTVSQMKQLNAYGIEDTTPYLVQKNTSTLLQIVNRNTGDVIKFKKIVDRHNVSLERITAAEHDDKHPVNPCLDCDCYDPDMGCSMPTVDRSYACPL